MHPAWLRCSSLKYSRYSRSSRLAERAPHPSRWDAGLSPRAARDGILPHALETSRAVDRTGHGRARRLVFLAGALDARGAAVSAAAGAVGRPEAGRLGQGTDARPDR